MKRTLSLCLTLFLVLGVLSGCQLITDRTCRVEFYVDGTFYTSTYGVSGSTLNLPSDPYIENMHFDGWYLDASLTSPYNPAGPIWTDLKLYASFVPDAVSLTNMITSETVKSLVKIENRCYNIGIISGSSATSQGSGVIYQVSNGYCYVLTNAHVVEKTAGYSNQSFTVADAYGNEYDAQLYKSSKTGLLAYSEESDLALLYFKCSEEVAISAVTFAKEEAAIGEYVVALGSPLGQINAISVGIVGSFGKIKLSDGETSFDGIYHSAPIDHGSSGGPLVNTQGELVGLNFAGSENSSYGCAIPLSVIEKFINTYVFAR